MVDGKSAGTAGDRERTVMRRQFLGFVYQYHHLLPEFSAIENVMLPQMLNGQSRAEARRRAAELLAMVQLKERARPPAGPAVGRRAAARGDRPRHRQRPARAAGRRADGQSRFLDG